MRSLNNLNIKFCRFFHRDSAGGIFFLCSGILIDENGKAVCVRQKGNIDTKRPLPNVQMHAILSSEKILSKPTFVRASAFNGTCSGAFFVSWLKEAAIWAKEVRDMDAGPSHSRYMSFFMYLLFGMFFSSLSMSVVYQRR
jgi:hypothetical protein